MLAGGTVIGASAGLTDLPDDATATQAWLPGSIINARLNLEAARPAVAMDVIANTAAARRYRVRQRFTDGGSKYCIAFPADPVGRPQRGYPGPE